MLIKWKSVIDLAGTIVSNLNFSHQCKDAADKDKRMLDKINIDFSFKD